MYKVLDVVKDLRIIEIKSSTEVICECIFCGRNLSKRMPNLKKLQNQGCRLCPMQDKLLKQQFHKLTVICRLGEKDKFGHYFYLLECECGNLKQGIKKNLESGDLKSCGCLYTDSLTNRYPNIYKRWVGMRKRCQSPCNASYKNYSSSGIEVFDSWNNFSVFLEYMLTLYPTDLEELLFQGYQLDRIDNTIGYIPGNIQLLTRKENCRKRKTTHWINIGGYTCSLQEAIETFGKVPKIVYQRRMKRGWPKLWALLLPSGLSKLELVELEKSHAV